jgi:hypothetical protein
MKTLQFQTYTVVIDKKSITFNKYPVNIEFLTAAIESADISGRKSASVGCVLITLEEAKLIQDIYYQINPKT